MNDFELDVTQTYEKISAMTSRIKVVQGSQASGKNFAIETILLEKAEEGRKVITIMTDTFVNLKDGAILDYQKIWDWNGWDWRKDYNGSDHDLRVGNSVIQFRHLSDQSTGKSKRRDILYINEANKIGWEQAATFIGRTHGDIYIDFNPDRMFWAHTEIPKMVDDETGEPLSSQIIVTFKDNQRCPKSERQIIESRKHNTEWYRVYGLGQIGFYSSRQIYTYELMGEGEEIPRTARRVPAGMDFGMNPDKTALVALFVDGNNLYCDLIFAQNDLKPEKLAGAKEMSIVDKLKEVGWNKNHRIIADSAGGTEIRDLRKHGYNVTPSKKPKNGQLDGINMVKGYDIKLTRHSLEIKEDMDDWYFKVDKRTGNVIAEPEGHEPDTLAAIRYAMMKQRVQMTDEQAVKWNKYLP